MSKNNWTENFQVIEEKFESKFGNLSEDQLNWKANPDSWSIAEVMEHLIKTADSYRPTFKAIRENTNETPWLSSRNFLANFFGKMILKSVEPTRMRKVKTFPIWDPSKSAIEMGILDRFRRHHRSLNDLIENNQDLMGKGLKVSSPANKNIVYPLDILFDILLDHELRHYAQAEETLKAQSRGI